MSIRQTQIENVFDIVAQAHMVDGQNPLLDDIYRYLNRFFANQPAGSPYKIPFNTIAEVRKSDPEVFNDFMATVIANVDTLYETCFNQVDQILALNTVLRNHLDRLRIKRSLLNSKIEDYLLGIYNSDGYFYSFSDDFVDTAETDFNYTDAFIDTSTGSVTIPAISTKSRVISPDSIVVSEIKVTDITGKTQQYTEKSRFDDCLDGLTNTAWFFEVKTNDPAPIIVDIQFEFSNQLSETIISKIDLSPHGIEDIQLGINAVYQPDLGAPVLMPFSSQIQTKNDKMTFLADQPRENLRSLRFQIRKTKPDYFINDAYERTNVYMFGFKEIIISEQYFDPSARWVSEPISIPAELGDEALVDAVSLSIIDHTPTGTGITYYVAKDNPDAQNISQYSWQQIEPLTDSAQLPTQIVKFGGTEALTQYLRLVKRVDSDIPIFPLNSTHVDVTKRNPTPSYFTGIDTYRIAPFVEDFLMSTITLEEGINSTRIFYTDLSSLAYSNGFEFWRGKFDSGDYSTAFGEIDTGHGYFYGADVGENGKSCYAETFVYVDEELPVTLKECRKSDLNSRTWDVKIYLNGREIANLPVGTNKLTVPWKFKQGKNHVVVMSNIPSISGSSAAPYIGSFDLMADAELYDYGTVKLDDWTYVDAYKFQNNLTNESKAFTIYNGEVVSRRPPAKNFKLTFNRPRPTEAPEAIRVRADLKRSESFSYVTPILDSYRLRFSYTTKTGD